MLKETVVTLTDGGEEKKFKIRQLPATKGERLKLKILIMLGAETNIDNLKKSNPYEFMGVLLNALSKQPYEKIQEILDETISCVSRVQEGGIECQLTSQNVDGYVEDSETLMALRGEVIKINNFFHQSGKPGSDKSPAPAVTIKRPK